MEPVLEKVAIGDTVQFERLGYFCKDPDSRENTIFNRTVPLRDSWAKIEKQMLSGHKN
jgi:glutaminyl-tRNA synthetase